MGQGRRSHPSNHRHRPGVHDIDRDKVGAASDKAGAAIGRQPFESQRSDSMIQLPRRKFLHLAAGTVALPAVSRIARAQAWPSRPVRLIVPYPAGGGADTIARLVGGRLSEMWGQQVVIENRGGAGGNIASEAAARSAPDGYTLYLAGEFQSTNLYTYPKLNYDPVAD